MGKKHKNRLETTHHIVPRSRGGGDKDNTVRWPAHFHVLWHSLFENLTLEEVVEMITIMSQPGGRWTSAELKRLKRDIQSRRGF